MQQEPDSPEQHQRRSEFIRKLVQRGPSEHCAAAQFVHPPPRTIVQFWHDLQHLPSDIEECISSWSRWTKDGFLHSLFDEQTAKTFIGSSLGDRHVHAFERCYHPAMQSDYFRLCYLLVEGGCYVDADDACIGTDMAWLFDDGRLKLQPLCYDVATGSMVRAPDFLAVDAYEPSWIFYFNNNPLVASRGHPIIERALIQATRLLEHTEDGALPEIQSTTGPGNLSKSIFDLGMTPGADIDKHLVVLRDWDSFAISRWPLIHRDDARNWRLSNQKRFDPAQIAY